MLNVMIVDDEPPARARLGQVLLDCSNQVQLQLVGEAGGGIRGLEEVDRLNPDVVLLDVHMPDMNGIEMARHLAQRSNPPAVIFVTAYDEHALRAFEVHAIDYLLKPCDDARFAAALARAKAEARRREADGINARLVQLLELLRPGAGAAAPAAERPGERILVRSSGEILFLKPEEIDWIEAEGDYMKFHVAGRSHLMRETMARLEARLDPARFVRIHRSTIVNIDRVRKLSPSFAGEYAVILQDGTKLKLSRGYQERITAVLKQSL